MPFSSAICRMDGDIGVDGIDSSLVYFYLTLVYLYLGDKVNLWLENWKKLWGASTAPPQTLNKIGMAGAGGMAS